MTKLGGPAYCLRFPLHSYGVAMYQTRTRENDPNQNTPAKTNVPHKQTITRTHARSPVLLAPSMFTIVCPYEEAHRCLA